MSNRVIWIFFTACSLVWLAVSLALPPCMSGEDVYNFRDAGWNLASQGRFESAALVQMHDLRPRLYAHYTPMMPLLFAGYAAVFPRTAYAGTIFNLLLGIAAAAVVLYVVLRQPPNRLRNTAAIAVAAVPAVFITYDRPEALALVISATAIALLARPFARPLLAGALIAIAFLAHPFAACAVALWTAALFLAANWKAPARWMVSARQVVVSAAVAFAVVVPVALGFYLADHESLHRFAAHALGIHSGLGVVVSQNHGGGFAAGMRKSILGAGPFEAWNFLMSLVSSLALAAWAIARRRGLSPHEWLPVVAALGCAFTAVVLFPAQRNYTTFLAYLTPVGLLAVAARADRLAAPALALLLFAVAINLPQAAFTLVKRYEQRPSYLASLQQPQLLLAQLPDREATVAVEGDSYDLFKPEFDHMIRIKEVDDGDHFAKVAALANCYDGYKGTAVLPLPAKLNAADFRLIQPDPAHLWITLFGRKVMRAQWGFGCDLYVRNNLAANATEGIRAGQ